MIINNLDNSSIKIIIDEEDLKNNEINLKEWISNPQKTNFFLKKLLKNYPEYQYLNFDIPKEINIYTFNFKIFYIKIKEN